MNLKKFRPEKLNDFIGQDNIKKDLEVYINYCLKNNIQLDHILLSGYSGLGKTTLANIIANEMKSKIHFIHGSNLCKVSDVLNIFSMINPKDIIFIDEVHKIDKNIFEIFYTIMEDFMVDIQLGIDNNQKSTRLKIPEFTLIAATNFIYKLPTSFIDRFTIKLNFKEYIESDIKNILINICKNNKIDYKDSELEYISRISRGNPRISINFLKRYITYKFFNHKDSQIEDIFKKIGIFDMGINETDINYLKLLKDGHSLSLKTISQKLNIDETTIQNNIEPYLVKIFFIEKSSKGRSLTHKGIEFLNNI